MDGRRVGGLVDGRRQISGHGLSVGDRKRIQWTAELLQRLVPTAGVDVLEPGVGKHYGWSLEVTLANVGHVRSDVLMAIVEEDLDLQLAQPCEEYYVIIAPA